MTTNCSVKYLYCLTRFIITFHYLFVHFMLIITIFMFLSNNHYKIMQPMKMVAEVHERVDCLNPQNIVCLFFSYIQLPGLILHAVRHNIYDKKRLYLSILSNHQCMVLCCFCNISDSSMDNNYKNVFLITSFKLYY